jgi:copper chaperone NosL
MNHFTFHASRFTFHVSRFTLPTLLLALLLAACGPKITADEPPEIAYGQDLCDHCGMIIDESRFAASYVTPTGEVRRFDTISDMLAYHQEAQEEVFVFWVHDYHTETWLKADEAFFVQSDNIVTPMGIGLVATADRGQADALVTEFGGTVMAFDVVLAQSQTGAMNHEPQPARPVVHEPHG